MNYCKRILTALCMILLLGAAVYADDSQGLTNEWFGADANQAAVLGIESIAPEDPQVSALLDQFFSLREADFDAQSGIALYSGAENEAVLAAPQLRSAVGPTHQELINALADRIDADILGATVTSFVESITETETGYEAMVYEWTFFDYDDLSDGVGGSDTAGFGTEHLITFGYDDAGQLQILSDDYTESDVLTGELPQEDLQEAELSADQKTVNYYADYGDLCQQICHPYAASRWRICRHQLLQPRLSPLCRTGWRLRELRFPVSLCRRLPADKWLVPLQRLLGMAYLCQPDSLFQSLWQYDQLPHSG